MTIDNKAVARLTGSEQLGFLEATQAAIDASQAELEEHRDFKALRAVKTLDEQSEIYTNMAPETLALWKDIGERKRELADLTFYLYHNSRWPEVRAATVGKVDELIENKLNKAASVKREYWHDLLYLCTFGGKMTRERQDVYHIAYEFNAVSKEGRKPAVPWNPIEILFEAGLTKVYDAETSGYNLTNAGKAAMKRMDELYGMPEARKNFTVAPGAIRPDDLVTREPVTAFKPARFTRKP